MEQLIKFATENIYLLCVDAFILFILFSYVVYVFCQLSKLQKTFIKYTKEIDNTAQMIEEEIKDEFDILMKRIDSLETKLKNTVPVSDVISTLSAQNEYTQTTKLKLLKMIKDHQVVLEESANALCFDSKQLKEIIPPTISELPEMKQLMESL